MADVTETLGQIINDPLEAMGYELVRVLLDQGAGKSGQRLQIMIDRADGQEVNVDDCVDVSHAVSALLDVEDPISGAYDLEVSSPGIDRPLTRLKDFVRFAGHEAKVELKHAHEGRRRFRGLVKGADDDHIVIMVDTEEFKLPFADLAKAKLVLTDELIKQSASNDE